MKDHTRQFLERCCESQSFAGDAARDELRAAQRALGPAVAEIQQLLVDYQDVEHEEARDIVGVTEEIKQTMGALLRISNSLRENVDQWLRVQRQAKDLEARLAKPMLEQGGVPVHVDDRPRTAPAQK